MKIGLMMGATGMETLDDVISMVKSAEAAGIDSIWMANIFSYDAISTLAIVGRETKTIELGTAVTPTYPRHPTAMAQQALTTAAASNCRFTLGIGLSHQIVIEGMLGLSYDKPARHMREYLNVLMPLVRGETCNFQGEHYRVSNMAITVPGATSMPVVVAALGPTMLKLAGELADGTNTWMVGPKTMENHIIARIGAAARDAGKPDPRIVAGFPVILTNKPDEAREKIAEQLAMYGQLPSYRAMLDLEGVAGPADIAIAGDENALRGEIKRLEDIGVTDFNAAITPVEEGSYERTLEFLTSMKP
ncbi:MAG: LLM class F420-dependent oxidoreductase [Pseudomonadales bacterium]